MKFIYPAIFSKTTEGTFEARFPDLECCTATGETLDDCIEMQIRLPMTGSMSN